MLSLSRRVPYAVLNFTGWPFKILTTALQNMENCLINKPKRAENGQIQCVTIALDPQMIEKVPYRLLKKFVRPKPMSKFITNLYMNLINYKNLKVSPLMFSQQFQCFRQCLWGRSSSVIFYMGYSDVKSHLWSVQLKSRWQSKTVEDVLGLRHQRSL